MLTSFATTAIWTMPTARDVASSPGRINPIVRSQYRRPHHRRRLGHAEAVQGRARAARGAPSARPGIGGPALDDLLLGASNEKDAVAMDADLLVHDEEDLSDPQIVDQFEHRLDASRFGWRFHLSTPRLPGPADAVFQDRRRAGWSAVGMRGGVRAAARAARPYANVEPDPTG
jgi:hypothetical protein